MPSGVPACYVRGRNGDVSHAWVGFVERGRRGLEWNFSSGRYRSYEDVEGRVRNPQTGASVPDAYLAVQLTSANRTREVRHRSVALYDAAMRQADGMGTNEFTSKFVRQQLSLVEGALRLDLGNIPAWEHGGVLVGARSATTAQKHWWAVAVDQMGSAACHRGKAELVMVSWLGTAPDGAWTGMGSLVAWNPPQVAASS